MKRSVTAEWLDSDQGTPEEIAASLGDLAMIARCFGGVSTLVALLRSVVSRTSLQTLTVLDVGAGSDAVARLARERLAREQVTLEFTLLDRSPHAASQDMKSVVADAFSLPFAEGAFDVVACSTFVHHFEPNELVRFANEALRVTRRAVVINDIRRHLIHLGLVCMGFPLFRSRITRHDGPASVRRAYTPQELREILSRTVAAKIDLSRHYLFRMGAVAWKQ